MLAVLKIRMTWTKENRTPEGAVLREQYCKPVRIEEDVPLLGEGIFLKECDCEQVGSQIFSNYDFAAQREKKKKNKPSTGLDNYRNKRKGYFYDNLGLEKRLLLPCIRIVEEADGCYRIKWFDQGIGKPRRAAAMRIL